MMGTYAMLDLTRRVATEAVGMDWGGAAMIATGSRPRAVGHFDRWHHEKWMIARPDRCWRHVPLGTVMH